MIEGSTQRLPNHIGFILDGNRRWAEMNGLPKLEGHREGFENLKTIADHAFEQGVPFVTAFVFSTENWKRTADEVSYLMNLARTMITRDLRELYEKGIRLVWIGSEDRIDKKLAKAIRDAEHKTKDNTRGTLALCFNYGGQREIVDAVRAIARKDIAPENINEELISEHLYAPGVPPVDLLIRTSGEQRISNFMLWRIAYSELLFVEKHWPAFTKADFDAALQEYSSRHRRFGR